jgi:hypothetical protein
MCMCMYVFNGERKIRDKEKRGDKIAYILRAYLSLFFSSLSLARCSKCMCVYNIRVCECKRDDDERGSTVS